MKKIVLITGMILMTTVLCKPKREEAIRVPDIINLTEESARDKLMKENLLFEITGTIESDEIAKGFIAKQSPLPGSMVKKGTTVKAWISTGPPIGRIVPDLVGLSLSEARRELEKLELKVGKVENVHSKEVPKDHIISTDPLAGEEVPKGSAVDLVVSLGPKTVVVPRVTGRRVENATAILESRGLKVRKIFRVSTEFYEGTVYDQKPEAGTTIPEGDTVTIFVATVLR